MTERPIRENGKSCAADNSAKTMTAMRKRLKRRIAVGSVLLSLTSNMPGTIAKKTEVRSSQRWFRCRRRGTSMSRQRPVRERTRKTSRESSLKRARQAGSRRGKKRAHHVMRRKRYPLNMNVRAPIRAPITLALNSLSRRKPNIPASANAGRLSS